MAVRTTARQTPEQQARQEANPETKLKKAMVPRQEPTTNQHLPSPEAPTARTMSKGLVKVVQTPTKRVPREAPAAI
ncbi:hypothetical protein RsS93_35710 [Rhizobium dioscoreae]|uniref:Uncharacterized protein n=1 Tax=Rhizobium dioscoreae TaxID=2653122 RepID=A0ABQ0Z6Q8_9HYPH|nr:hypothetical protein RsS93_35710 [Rhizobium dioscoreae]